MNNEFKIEELVSKLVRIHDQSTKLIVQTKTKKALANIKRAKTLLEKAEQTLIWAEYFIRTNQQ